MSISNLQIPNSYSIFCRDITTLVYTNRNQPIFYNKIPSQNAKYNANLPQIIPPSSTVYGLFAVNIQNVLGKSDYIFTVDARLQTTDRNQTGRVWVDIQVKNITKNITITYSGVRKRWWKNIQLFNSRTIAITGVMDKLDIQTAKIDPDDIIEYSIGIRNNTDNDLFYDTSLAIGVSSISEFYSSSVPVVIQTSGANQDLLKSQIAFE